MKTENGQPMTRDRTYKRLSEAEFITKRQFLIIIVWLLATHLAFEVMYLWLGCLPMIIVNIGSILVYVLCIILGLKGVSLTVIWIIVTEVYLHVIFTSIFMGMACGYQLWLFGSLSSVYFPFFLPGLSGLQKKQIVFFSGVVIATFLVLTALDDLGLLSARYNAPPEVARALYYFNGALGFSAIIIYVSIFNKRMMDKNHELQMAANHDFLTGIFNRQRLQRIIDAEIEREQDLPENHLNVAMVDIDFFKKINDTHGHEVGDIALIELANIFTSYEDSGLLYGRWGGEEFLLIAPENMSYNEFGKLLEKIRQQVEDNEFIAGDKTIKYTISIGASSYKKGMSSEQLINAADDRLYHAKKTGRNKVVY